VGQVDHDRIFGDRMPGEAVPAATHSDTHAILLCHFQNARDLRGGPRLDDQRRPPSDIPVPDRRSKRRVVALIRRGENWPGE
jgi:hypothetical protein